MTGLGEAFAAGAAKGAGAAAVKVVVSKPSGRLLAWMNAKLVGKIVMIVGPPSAGKSTFLQYFQHGILLGEQESERTYEPVGSGHFRLALGPNDSLGLRVREAYDTPGQNANVADYAFDRRPDALVVVVDVSADLGDGTSGSTGTLAWLADFLDRWEQRAGSSRPRRLRVRSIQVLLNKQDKVDQATLQTTRTAIENLCNTKLHVGRGRFVRSVHYRSTVLVQSRAGTESIDAVIVDLATALRRK